jgi:hypothetical protein
MIALDAFDPDEIYADRFRRACQVQRPTHRDTSDSSASSRPAPTDRGLEQMIAAANARRLFR